jgi:hypothetical protein
MSATIAKLRAAVRDSGTPLASSLGERPPAAGEESAAANQQPPTPGAGPTAAATQQPPPPGEERGLLAASGPRAAAHRDDVEIAVAAVDEGYRLHYGAPRALRIDDPDLALLAGDRLYALGLARLATIGDMAAIAELADLISLSAQAHANGDEELAAAVWQAGVAAIGWGETPRIADAKARARSGDPGAAQALREAAQAQFDTPVT